VLLAGCAVGFEIDTAPPARQQEPIAASSRSADRTQAGRTVQPLRLVQRDLRPEAICKYRGLPLGAKMVYGRLCRYAGRDGAVYPSMSALAAELDIGKTQARTYVQELERKHFIAVDRENRHFFPNGSGGSNKYVFLWHVAFDGEEGKSRKTPEGKRIIIKRVRKKKVNQKEVGSCAACIDGFGRKEPKRRTLSLLMMMRSTPRCPGTALLWRSCAPRSGRRPGASRYVSKTSAG